MPRDNERGAAMVIVVMATAALAFLVILMFQQATTEFAASQTQRREDTLVAGAEAMLERYAAKLTIDPLYYMHRVDEAELPRRCTDVASPSHDIRVEPGGAWFEDCESWDYEEPTGYFVHPLLDGEPDVASDDIGTLMTVLPPIDGTGLYVTIVTRHEEFRQARAITAQIAPEAVSQFAFLVQDSLVFGGGVHVDGKIYAGIDVDFYIKENPGTVTRNVFAEGAIGLRGGHYGPPIFQEDAIGFDSTGNYEHIRSAHRERLDFGEFWDDLVDLERVACEGAGLCLDRSRNASLGLTQDPTAWLIEPVVVGTLGKLRVSAAYSNESRACVTSEEWWWLNSQSATWTLVGEFDIPHSGAEWANETVVIGKDLPARVKGAVTIGAGSVGAPKNIVIGNDILYDGGTTGMDVLGLAATDEVWVNPSAVGVDAALTINAAILTQSGSFSVARKCGANGEVQLPRTGSIPDSTLTVNGSFAMLYTGDVAAHFFPRNYIYDRRLERIRPPFFPVLGDGWLYGNWRETTLPCWARITGSC